MLHGGPGRDSLNGFRGDDVLYGGGGATGCTGTKARMSSTAGMATISLTRP